MELEVIDRPVARGGKPPDRVVEGPPLPPGPRGRFADNAVFGMAIAVFVEVMLFAGFISAFVIVKSGVAPGLWPPPDQPRLPVATTAFNTALLLASGVVLFLAHRAYARHGARAAARPMGIAILLGGMFVLFQGVEWLRLIGQGLTLTSSQLGSFFYLIVGAHALHAAAALVALAVFWRAIRAERLSRSAFGAVQLFWYFVVLMWPLIYWQVYG
jgi:heme/copper-type cytochrome/quinol oxidase subunit 3